MNVFSAEENKYLDAVWRRVYEQCEKRNGSNIIIEIATGSYSWMLYGDNGARNFVGMGSEYSDGIHGVEGRSIVESDIPDILSYNSHIELVDLGCGDGTAALPLIKNINSNLSYRPVDVSNYMLNLAEENVKRYTNDVTIKNRLLTNFQDLTDCKDILETGIPKCYLLLGQTLGNHVRLNNPTGAIEVIENVSAVMKQKDKILIGVDSTPDDIGKTVKNYNGSTVRRFVSTASETIGINTDLASYHVRYLSNGDVGEVLLSLLFPEWQTIEYPGINEKLKNKTIEILPGDEILTSNSARLSLGRLEEICESGGIKRVSYYMSPENYILYLGKKI